MIVNGKEYDLKSITVLQLLNNFGLEENKVVVEVDFNIIAKENFKDRVIDSSSKVEIVAFVGGG